MRTPKAARAAPVFRGIAPRLSMWLAVAAGTLVMLVAIFLCEQHAGRAVKRHQQRIGDDLVQSVNRILDRVVSGRRPELAALAGQPCRKISRVLAELETRLRYVRAVALVEIDSKSSIATS